MALKTFSLEEAYGKSTELVPAKRTPRASFVDEIIPTEQPAQTDDKATVQKHFNTVAEEFGLKINQIERSPEENATLKGAAKNSQHLQGTAVDYSTHGLDGEKIAAVEKRMHALGFEGGYTTRGTAPHMHFELAKGRTLAKPDLSGAGGSGSTAAPTKAKTFSLEDAYGPVVTNQPVKTDKGFLVNSAEAIKDSAKRGFDVIMERLNNTPEQVERTPEEIKFLVDKEIKEGHERSPYFIKDTPQYRATLTEKFRFTRPMASEDSLERVQAQEKKDIIASSAGVEEAKGKGLSGIFSNLRNPVENILNDSLPADILKAVSRAPEHERAAYNKLRETMMQQNIVDNPTKFPKVSVEAAQAAIDARKEKQPVAIAKMWNDLHQAYKENPEGLGVSLINSLAADPEMLLAPMGSGVKMISGGKKLATGFEASGKVVKLADHILDAGVTGATLNIAMESANQAALGKNISRNDLANAGISGFVLSGALAPLFAKGAMGRGAIKAGNLSDETFEAASRAAAQEELLIEDIIEAPKTEIIYLPDGRPVPADLRERIELDLGIIDSTGTAKLSPAQRQKLLAQERNKWKKQFAEDWENLDHQKYKADERMQRSALWAEREAAKAEEAAAAKAIQDAEAGRLSADQEAKARQFSEDYDKALRARDQSEMVRLQEEAEADNISFDKLKKLEQDDALVAAYDKNVPQIKQMFAKAERRDPKAWKYQRGEIDPELAARLGLAGTAATIGYVLSPEDKKMQGGFLGLLTGLFVPGGGRTSVLSKMRQSGAVSPDGNILGVMFKENKLPNESHIIERAKAGDQQAYAELYNQYFPRLERASRQFVRTAGPKLGIEPSDIAQDAFVQGFKNLDKFKGDSEFYTWMHSIMRNEGLQAIRKADSRIDTTSMYNSGGDAGPGNLSSGHIMEGDQSLVKGNVEAASSTLDTPENIARAQEVEAQIAKAFAKLPTKEKQVLTLKELEGFDDAEIAAQLNMSEANVRAYATRAKTTVLAELAKDLGVGKPVPRNQRGEVDPRLLKAGAVAALGAGAYGFLDSENKKLAAGLTMLIGAGLIFSKGRTGESLTQGVIQGLDKTLGVMSTRTMNISKPVWWRTIEHFRTVLKDTHQHMKAVDPFLVQVENLNPETKGLIQRAILTGKQNVTQKVLEAIGNPELLNGWKSVRATLDTLGDQLVHLKRFKRGGFEYFPRIVKDVAGLMKALGKEKGDFLSEILKDANTKSLANRGMELSDIERSKIINDALMSESKLGAQPGFAKNRGVQEITKELQPFYATPTESLHSYIRSAVEDIQTAKFFGKDLEVVKKGDKEYTNVDKSIGKMVLELQTSGQINEAKANELSSVLKTLFINDKGMPNEVLQKVKNLSYAGLLGNPLSAISQLGDVVIQGYIQDTRSALVATAKVLTGKAKLNAKDFGLADHLAEEFVSTDGTAKFLQKALKYGLFSKIDLFGKDVALNAAVNRLGRLSKGEMGIKKIEAKYNEFLQPGEIKDLIRDLHKGETTDLVRAVAFAEMSRTQPITKFEMPQVFVDNPNGRVLYQFKTFMLKQLDVARRDAFNEIKKGNIATGVKNLTTLGIALGVGGMATDKIKKFFMNSAMSLLGHTPEAIEFQASDIPMNMLKTFGLSEYILDKAQGMSKERAAEEREAGNKFARTKKPDVAGAMADLVSTPAGQIADVATANPKALRYIPFLGPFLYEDYQRKKAEAAE